MKQYITTAILLLAMCGSAHGQKVSISTNLVKWGTLGTVNAELEASVSQHISLFAGGDYNPWSFKSKDMPMYIHQEAAFAGVKYWPWYVYSGWWVSGKLIYRHFAETGLWRPALVDATGVGLGLSAGYTIMINKHLNIDLGLGGWGGKYTDYALYCCPVCMDIRESGSKMFLLPDELRVSLIFILNK